MQRHRRTFIATLTTLALGTSIPALAATQFAQGKRGVRKIEFWYETKGILNGRADVTIFGQK